MVNNILSTQPTEENPHIVDSYPYGRLRCICKFWIESNVKRGDRWVKQTQNPKTMVWNNPKKSTYVGVMVAYLDEKGHADYKPLWTGTDAEKYKEFVEFVGDSVTLNKIQLDRMKYIRAIIKAYSGVTFTIDSPQNRTEEEQKKHDEGQANIQRNINMSVNHNYNTDEGAL